MANADRAVRKGEEATMTFLSILLWFIVGRYGGLSNDGFWIFTAICLLITTVDLAVPKNYTKTKRS